jgi:hypothetical protein
MAAKGLGAKESQFFATILRNMKNKPDVSFPSYLTPPRPLSSIHLLPHVHPQFLTIYCPLPDSSLTYYLPI